VIDHVIAGTATLRTDPRASPTGYPFKIVERPGDRAAHESRRRMCDLGYLRVPVRREGGRLLYRCAAEPVEHYVEKGGDPADTVGRRCLCNGLTATIGLGQHRSGDRPEPELITSGDDLMSIGMFLEGRRSFTADDVIDYLTLPVPSGQPAVL
jgi:hypothetical protein